MNHMKALRYFAELRGDAQLPSGFSDTPFKHHPHIESAADVTNIFVRILEGEG